MKMKTTPFYQPKYTASSRRRKQKFTKIIL